MNYRIAKPFLIVLMLVSVAGYEIKAEAWQSVRAPSSNTAGPNLEGTWEGTLDLGALKLRLALNVTRASDGALAAKFQSLDQGTGELPVDVIGLRDRAVHFELKRLFASFDGTLNQAGSEISGQFSQGGAFFPLTLKRVAKLTALNRPQEPKPPYPYDAEDVSYENKRDGIKLAGTLTMPRDKSSVPALCRLRAKRCMFWTRSPRPCRVFLV